MTNTIIFPILLVFLGINLGYCQNDQYIHTTLNRVNLSNNIEIHNLGGNTSFISFGDIDMLDQNDNIVKLFEYQKLEDFELIFQIENIQQNEFSFSCGSISTPFEPQFHELKFVNGLCKIFYGGDEISTFEYVSEGIFKIYKCKASMTYYYDGEIKYSSFISSEIDVYSHFLNVTTSIDTDIFMATHKIEEECIPPYDTDLYYSLKINYPKNIAKISEGKLNVSFIQKYNVPADEISKIKIFNYDRTNNSSVNEPLHESNLEKVYGPNYISIDIDELDLGLLEDKIYTLEINNINKGKTYYLKFKV